MICLDVRRALTNHFCGLIKFAHCYRSCVVLFLNLLVISIKIISFKQCYYSLLSKLYSFSFFVFTYYTS